MSAASKWSSEIKVGALILVALGMAFYLSLQVGHFQALGGALHVTIIMEDASGLAVDNAVKIAGVDVGRIDSIGVDFDKARVGITVDKSAALRADAVPMVRAKSLLGEKFLELKPVSREAPLVKDGDTLTATVTPVEPDQIFNTVGGFMGAISPEDVRTVFEQLQSLLTGNREHINRIIANTDELLQAGVDARREHGADLVALLKDLRGTMASVNQTIGTLETNKEDVKSLLVNLRHLTAEMDRKLPGLLDRADRLSAKAEPMADDMAVVLGQLKATLDRMGPLLEKANVITEEDIHRILREQGIKIHIGRMFGE